MNDEDQAYYDYLLEREAPRIPQDAVQMAEAPGATMTDAAPVAAGTVRPGAMEGQISAIPRQPVVGAVADFVGKVREFANQYEVQDWVPLLGGMSVGDLFIGKSPEEIENLAYGNFPMVMPQQSNIPVMKPGRKESVADTAFLGLDVAGLAPLAKVAAKGVGQIGREIATTPPVGAISPEIAAKVLPQTKIVDEAGNPQLMYHGTREDFEEFSPGSRGAIFATPENEEFLQPYLGRFFNTKTGNFEFASGANVRPVYINAKNPFDYENPSHVDKLMKVLGKSDPEFFAETTVGRQLKRRLEQGNWEEIETRDVQKAIKKLGFDGFYVNEGNVKNIAVFDPKQIRSATSDPQMVDLLDQPTEQLRSNVNGNK